MTVVNPTDDNLTLWAGMLNAFANAHGAGGIVSGCSISKGTGDWDIDVTSGSIIEANTEASISSGTETITDASGLTSGQSRVTLIHADTGDTIASTDGSAASNPTTPDIPAGEVLLGFVVVSEGDSTVADSDIFDIPGLLQNVNALYKDGGSHELDASDLAGGAGAANAFLQTDGAALSYYDLLGAMATESGSFSYSDGGTQTINLSNTYDADFFLCAVSAESTNESSGSTGGTTTGSSGARLTAINLTGGDVTGVDITHSTGVTGSVQSASVNWHVMGRTV